MNGERDRLFLGFGWGIKKWFLNGPLFKSSSEQMAGWVSTIEQPYL